MPSNKDNKISKYQYNKEEDEVSLSRKGLRETLVRACESIDLPYVIAIKGNYGTGKSMFLHHLKNDLEEKNIATLYFNAWENDYIQNPFLSLVTRFDTEILDKYFKNETIQKNIINTAKQIALATGKGLIKRAGEKYIGTQATEEITKTLVNTKAPSLPDSMTPDLLIYKKAQQSFEYFKNHLEEAAKSMTEKNSQNTSNQKMQSKIVILVDELDRCKPDYAIQLLEMVKHFFEAQGVIFIFSICEKAIRGSVSSVYHPDIDYVGYMNKFIDITFTLPEISHYSYWECMEKGAADILPKVIKTTFPALAKGYNASLRDQNHILSALLFSYQILPRSYNKDGLDFPHSDEHSLLLLFYIFSLKCPDFPASDCYEPDKLSKLVETLALEKVNFERSDNMLRKVIIGYYSAYMTMDYENMQKNFLNVSKFLEQYDRLLRTYRSGYNYNGETSSILTNEERGLPFHSYIKDCLQEFKSLHLGQMFSSE